jgi:hypothetical protein
VLCADCASLLCVAVCSVLPEISGKWKTTVLDSHRSLLSYPNPELTSSLCQSPLAPVPSSSSSSSRSSAAAASAEEEVVIELRDVVLALLKFLEVGMLLSFTIVCFVLLMRCALKVGQQCCSTGMQREGYTIIS